MRKSAFGLLPALLIMFALSVAAQQQPPQKQPPPPVPNQIPPQTQPMPVVQPVIPIQPVVIPCPKFQVQGPNRPMREGEAVVFAANVAGGDPATQPVYNWTVSPGTITGGQGTRSITVDSSGAGTGRQIVAEVLVEGYSYACANQATFTARIAPPANKVDEFGDLPEKDETGKLESIINFLGQNPDRVFIIGYAGKTNPRGYAAEVLKRMKAYIIKSGSVADRVGAIDGGFRETPSYEIWVVPFGAEAPKPTPTIDRKDIVFPKPPPRTPAKKP